MLQHSQKPMKPFPEERCEQLEVGIDYSTWSNEHLKVLLLRHDFSLDIATGPSRFHLASAMHHVELDLYNVWKKRMTWEPFFEARPDR